jgi:hypothetical protein
LQCWACSRHNKGKVLSVSQGRLLHSEHVNIAPSRQPTSSEGHNQACGAPVCTCVSTTHVLRDVDRPSCTHSGLHVA